MNDLMKKFLLCTYVWWEKGANRLMALYSLTWGKRCKPLLTLLLPFPASGQRSFWAEILMIWKMSPHHVSVPQGLPDPRRSGLSRGAPRRCQAAPAQRSRRPWSVQVDRRAHGPGNSIPRLRGPPLSPAMEDSPQIGGGGAGRGAGGMPLRRRGRRAGDSAARRAPAARRREPSCEPTPALLRPRQRSERPGPPHTRRLGGIGALPSRQSATVPSHPIPPAG